MNNTTDGFLPSYPSSENIATSLFYIAVFIFGSTGNLLVLLVVKRRRARTFNDIFIFNLAVSDLCLILVCIPAFTYKKLSGFRGSQFYCKAIWPMMTISLCSSVFTITLMAVYRCKVILHPFEPIIEKRSILPPITAVWLLAIVFALPLFILAKFEDGMAGCIEDWPSDLHRKVYTTILMIVQYFLPLFIIAVAYVLIAIDLTRSRKRKSSYNSPKVMGRARREENLRVIKILATIVITFALFLLPGHIAWMILDFGREQDKKVAEAIFKFSDALVIFHSALNPVIYGTLTKQFRQGYKKYLSYVFCCKFVKDGRMESDYFDESRSRNGFKAKKELSLQKKEEQNILAAPGGEM
ncbi:predicted protein [Nematostella vectensis]|uniref:G-protein coupled receptors family 1 profile domain-containing protein n=1 Tax=Nematostella vectensis TaxID=45351 RepID=A7SGB7_NEMVE|nr:pyroglutamylated RF-amide peptide receptor [Nematostella vectensis]EDO37217.1 predicted protein [Nematostella vectensis]|eukprot:XP_001629280.1 predicted protein [Nematostella vectensis]